MSDTTQDCLLTRVVVLPNGNGHPLSMSAWYWESWDWLVDNGKVKPERSIRLAWEYSESSIFPTPSVFQNSMECHIYAQICHHIDLDDGVTNDNRQAWDPRNFHETCMPMSWPQFVRYAELFTPA